jgi:hypothetical protein
VEGDGSADESGCQVPDRKLEAALMTVEPTKTGVWSEPWDSFTSRPTAISN